MGAYIKLEHTRSVYQSWTQVDDYGWVTCQRIKFSAMLMPKSCWAAMSCKLWAISREAWVWAYVACSHDIPLSKSFFARFTPGGLLLPLLEVASDTSTPSELICNLTFHFRITRASDSVKHFLSTKLGVLAESFWRSTRRGTSRKIAQRCSKAKSTSLGCFDWCRAKDSQMLLYNHSHPNPSYFDKFRGMLIHHAWCSPISFLNARPASLAQSNATASISKCLESAPKLKFLLLIENNQVLRDGEVRFGKQSLLCNQIKKIKKN